MIIAAPLELGHEQEEKEEEEKEEHNAGEDKGAEGLGEIGHGRIIRLSLERSSPVKHWGVTRGTRLGRRRAQELVRRARPPDACLGKWPKLKAIWAWCWTHPPLIPFFFFGSSCCFRSEG